MFLKKFWFVVVTSTLLLQRCFTDEAVSTVKTSSGRSSYLNAESQSSNVEITPASFSKSDSSISASQSEVSQNDSSLVNTEDGVSLQDSSYYSSNSNVSGSNYSNIVASDGFISQNETNFAASSSSTAESDSSFTATPSGTIASSTTSSSTSTSSSSSTSSRSVNGEFTDDSEADISFPDDFLRINPSHQTKSLDSIPDFPSDSFDSKRFLESQNSGGSPPPNFKPFPGSPNSKLPPNFLQSPSSLRNNSIKKYGSKTLYSPAGLFNSRPTQKTDTPTGPGGMTTSFLSNSNDELLHNPHINEPFPSLPNSSVNGPLPSDSLSTTSLQNNNFPSSEPFQHPLNSGTPNTFSDSALDSPTNNPFLDDNLLQSPLNSLDNNVSAPYDLAIDENLTTSSPISDDHIPHLGAPDTLDDNLIPDDISPPTHLPTTIDSDLSDHLREHSSFDDSLSVHHPEGTDTTSSSQNAAIEMNQIPLGDSILDHHTPLDSTNSLDSGNILETSLQPLHPGDSPEDEHPSSPNDSLIPHSEQYTSTEINSDDTDIHITDDETITSPYDSTSDDLIHTNSPFAQLQSHQPYDILKDLPATDNEVPTPESPYDSNIKPEDSIVPNQYSSPISLESMDKNQDGLISPEETYLHPEDDIPNQYSNPIGLESMDINQDGFISPEEILEANNHTPETLDSTNSDQNDSASPKIPELYTPSVESPDSPSPYLTQPGYDDSINLPDSYPDRFSSYDQPSHSSQGQPLLHQPHKEYPQKPNIRLPSTYPDFNMPPRISYPRPTYPLTFPYDDLPFPKRVGPPFYSPSPSFFTKGFSNYPPTYGSPVIPTPSLYDYSANFLKPLPWSQYHLTPGSYSTLSLPSPGNPFLNKPMYSHPGPTFDSYHRPHYVPKNWSKIPSSINEAQLPQFMDSISNPLSPSPTDLDSLPNTQPSVDLSPSPYDSYTTDSSVDSGQPSISLDFNDSPPTVSNTLPFSALNNDSPFTSPNYLPSASLDLTNSPLPEPIPHSSTTSSLELDIKLPLTPSDLPGTLPPTMDDEVFSFLKDRYKKLSNSIYPRDIAVDFDTMTDAELTFNFVVLGSSPAVLSALKTLSNTGKSILLIERGSLPPHISKSLYYRPKILQSHYVRRIKSSAPHCEAEKILYAPNVLGEESTYDSNTWDYGVRSKYIKWGKLCKKWTWNNVIEYFTDGSDHPYSCAIPVTTDIEGTKAISTVTNIFNDAGLYRTDYHKGKRLEGLTVIPHLQQNGENIILAEHIFQQLTSCSNIKLALGTISESIVFDNVGKAIGVIVKTPSGATKTIYIMDELIVGTNPVDTVQFLYQSGVGDHEKLQQLNIPTQINLPYVGKELIITPMHFGVVYLFPQGTLLSDEESDLAGTSYLIGKYGLPSALAVDYFKAALNIYESHEANVVFNFRVFSKAMSERLNSYVERLKHIDEKIKDFLTNLCQEYDLLLAVPQLTNVLSRGEIMIDNSSGQFEALVNTGMYKSKRDITIMQKALKVLKSLAETETFKSMNGKVVQIPVEQCGTPDFSTEYNRCSIRYLSLPNLHYCGGTIMGVNPLTSVVNEDLLVHGTKNVRIFSASVVPYGTSTDSSAVSSMIGNLAAHIIFQNYSS